MDAKAEAETAAAVCLLKCLKEPQKDNINSQFPYYYYYTFYISPTLIFYF